MELRILSDDDVRAAIDMAEAIDAVSEAFLEIGRREAVVPLRTQVATEDGVALFMPAYLPRAAALGAKIVSVYERNKERDLPSVNAVVLALDPGTGMIRALVEATWLTALRTGAVSGLATDLLARHDAAVLTIFGAGAQARTQLAAIRTVRTIGEIRIVSRTRVTAERFAEEVREGRHGGASAGDPAPAVRVSEDPEAAVGDADIVVTATDSATPVFDGGAIRAGTHVNGIGSFTPEMQEVDGTLVRRSRIIVDSREAAMAEAGDLIIPIRQGVIPADYPPAELGEIVSGRRPGRQSDSEITFFKSVGNAAQDVAVMARILERAEREGLGRIVRI